MGLHRPFYVDSPSTLDSTTDEGDFAVDPDQLHDKLPQPFRLVDKILNGLFEDAWSAIAQRQREMEFEASRRHLPKVEGGTRVALAYHLHQLNTTPDGKLLLGAGPGGLIAFSGEDPTRPVYKLNNDSGGFLQVESAQGSEPETYIAVALNPQGIVTVFGVTRGGIFTIADLPNQEGETVLGIRLKESTMALTVVDQDDACSLVFLSLPVAAWADPLEESTTARLQGNDEDGVIFAKIEPKGRIRAPDPVTPCTKTSLFDALQPILGTINSPVPLGLGTHHILSKQYFDNRRAVLEKLPKYQGMDWEHADTCVKIGSAVFTADCRVLVWWTEFPTATVHSLSNTDIEPPLDSFMFGSPITCLECNPGGSVLAVGLETGMVSVVRLRDGITLQTTLTSRSPVTELRFIGEKVLASCQDGRVSVLSGVTEGNCAAIQHISSASLTYSPTQLLSIPTFPNIAVASLSPGRVCVLDVASYRAIATLPTSKTVPYCGTLDSRLVYVGELDLSGLRKLLTALHPLAPRVHRLPPSLTQEQGLVKEMHVFDLSRDSHVTGAAAETVEPATEATLDQLSKHYFTKREAERGVRHERQRDRWFQFTEELECY